MMIKKKILATLVLLAVMTALIHLGKVFWAPGTARLEKTKDFIGNIPAKALGSPAAPIKIVEYTDFQCPACTAGAQVIKEFVKRYPSQIYLEYRHYPILQLHPRALTIAVYAECASHQGRFWDYHDRLFEYRNELMSYADFENKLRDLAVLAGLDPVRLGQCVSDDAVEASVLAEKEEGLAQGVHATPTYFVNGVMVVGARLIQDELNSQLGKLRLTSGNAP